MCMVDNPMCDPAAIERHYRDTDELPFDDFFVKCEHCGGLFSTVEMDAELDDVCNNCVASVLKRAGRILEKHMYHAEYDLYTRVIKKYADGVI